MIKEVFLFHPQGSRLVLSWVPGWLRRVEHHCHVRAGRRADDHAAQPATAVSPSGLSSSVSTLPAAGHQHRVFLRQVSAQIWTKKYPEVYISVS